MLCGTCGSVCSYVLHTLGTVSITHVLLLSTNGYIEWLLHHPSHVVCIHRGVEDTTHWYHGLGDVAVPVAIHSSRYAPAILYTDSM